ncbi:hypothetical protein PILCRDRAFT_12091 [Piloderma croceum F 1598]|uniref:Uncharacterized protein n=1 Tax=Piloderma croceum (strain F 1598) TaxID=765440 RepID=A0A0C3EXL4_PILCF|nr:hypothetical protein PILCRDRAFT_12091 [Piloderma croceum F 1598]
MAQFQVAVGLQEVEGVSVGLQSPSRAKLREGMGGDVVYAPPASPFIIYPLPSPLYPLLILLTAHWWAV